MIIADRYPDYQQFLYDRDPLTGGKSIITQGVQISQSALSDIPHLTTEANRIVGDQEFEKFPWPKSTPESFASFAQWAFGKDGLPGLQILAFGGFTAPGKYLEHSIILCRNNASSEGNDKEGLRAYRRLEQKDVELQDLLQHNMGTLKACAVEY